MTLRNTMQAIALVAALGTPMSMAAQNLKAPSGGKKISKELIGIFFEDISHSADGGLYAELVQNGSFEYSPVERDGWGPGSFWRMMRHGHSTGYIEARMDSPLNDRNPHYMRIVAERVGRFSDFNGWTGVGIQNQGFDGIAVKAGAKYDFSVFMRNQEGKAMPVRIVLVGDRNKVLAEAELKTDGTGWKKYAQVLTAAEDCANAQLAVLAMEKGSLDVDMVSLMPQDTYKGHGLRKDLAETIAALEPKFVRFPGGCVVHGGGDGFWNTYRWKNTIGPKEERVAQKNTWGYHQSMGLGYFEYFQFCEDLGAEPIPILPVGVSCQGAGGSWGLREQAQMAVPMSEMDEWVDEALDLIEWANGDVTTEWGKKRAEAGHPEPFNLKYLGLGNEEKITPEFEERFKYIYYKIREKHPEIIIVGTAGPGSHKGNPDYDTGWRIAEDIDLAILDEHYYEPRDYFLNNQQNYDNYPRKRKTKVYLGEYAAKDKKMADALYEALYLLGIERNGDVVVMTSYAPLLAKKGQTNWNPDLIYFDNTKVYPTCSYYVQQMFGTTAGDYYYGDVAKVEGADKFQGTSCVLNTEKRELYIKVVNAAAEAKKTAINLSRFKNLPAKATMTTISGQPDVENNYEVQPIAPVTKEVNISKKMNITAEPYSCSVIRIKL
ncbi:MAG: alpha-L-arabinofuranosidase C-terminal domain-containing protein [Bacteroidales bacterium]|nr:alpha-L-arabinofuranosidase C-terminal domain-containing protein [Bacteroidales bacterium]